jgi:hypothetical protein
MGIILSWVDEKVPARKSLAPGLLCSSAGKLGLERERRQRERALAEGESADGGR